MSAIGMKGKSESVWLAHFLVGILDGTSGKPLQRATMAHGDIILARGDAESNPPTEAGGENNSANLDGIHEIFSTLHVRKINLSPWRQLKKFGGGVRRRSR